jgi:hypothetical protein
MNDPTSLLFGLDTFTVADVERVENGVTDHFRSKPLVTKDR